MRSVKCMTKNFFFSAESRDLVAQSLTFHSGTTLDVSERQKFTLMIGLRGADIDPIDAAPPAAPFSIAFYVSDNEELDLMEDIHVAYGMSDCAGGKMAMGMPADSTMTIRDNDLGVCSLVICICHFVCL